MTRQLQRWEFHAMGTVCTVSVSAAPSETVRASRALKAARLEIAACERALSRFAAESDLSRLNRAGGSWVAVDERLIEALAIAVRARVETAGRFDPTVLPALLAAGYDRSFALLTDRAPTPLGGWKAGAQIELNRPCGRARLEPGAAVDLGGIGKGFAAARAVREIRLAWPGVTGALVDLGGDISLWGAAPEGGSWRIDIADPGDPGRVAGTLELTDGGIATSGRLTRRFGPGGRLHHLIDPETGMPSFEGPLAVTVVAQTAADAEAYATALAVSSLADARAQLAPRPELSALFFPSAGGPVAIGRLPVAVPPRLHGGFVITTTEGRSLCL